MNFDFLIDIFRYQTFGKPDGKVSIEDVVRRYALFPNEAIYLVDYKAAQIEPLSKNFNTIIGMDVPHQNSVTVLYEHVHAANLTPFLDYTKNLLTWGFHENNRALTEERDFYLCFYKTIHNRVILKSTTILQYDSNGKVRYSVGKLMDVTGLLPFQYFGFDFTGPGSNKIMAAFEGLSEFEPVLSRRELEVLFRVGEGMKSERIAMQLHISRHTVDTHKRAILRKLEAMNSMEAYKKACDKGLFRLLEKP
jgi:DNA-binding CsgD family transcriptional regulator